MTIYDFQDPDSHFKWENIEYDWPLFTPRQFQKALDIPEVGDAFDRDFAAMEAADVFVLLLPCGASAHLEAGWAIGKGKPTCVYYQRRMSFPHTILRGAPNRS